MEEHTRLRKNERQQHVLNIVSAGNVGSQDQIVEMLAKHGFAATQASVSRDLDELEITKVNGRYVRAAQTAAGMPYGNIFIGTAGDNLTVVKCGAGLASALAVKIDAANLDGIVGTIAGDDTIFIAVTGKSVQKRVNRGLRALFDV